MTATLDQSKALVDIACAQATGAVAQSAAAGKAKSTPDSGDSPATGTFGLWQPVIDACRACEARLVGSDHDFQKSAAAHEYRRAATAYMNQFVQINKDVAQRLQSRIAASPPVDFRQLHALVVEEAEDAYLDRVSADSFAALQADFINAMFRLRREMAKTETRGDS